MPQVDDVTIRDRTTITTRRFTQRETTWAEAAERYQHGTRIWLDIGPQKQAIRSLLTDANLDGIPIVHYTLRTTDNKHAAYASVADEMITWYEEEQTRPHGTRQQGGDGDDDS